MYTEFNLTDFFAATWGYKPAGKIKLDNNDQQPTIRQTGDRTAEFKLTQQNMVNKKSQVGFYGSYYNKDILGRDVFLPLTLGGIYLPYMWINVKLSKRIVETPMTERRGSVIEVISFENVNIGVKGFDPQQTPREPILPTRNKMLKTI